VLCPIRDRPIVYHIDAQAEDSDTTDTNNTNDTSDTNLVGNSPGRKKKFSRFA
jgi:hypothetical protein